jgi:hypothetical protein
VDAWLKMTVSEANINSWRNPFQYHVYKNRTTC